MKHLTTGEIIAHVLYAALAALCITLAAQPHNPYVGVRMGVAVYVLVASSNLAHAYITQRWPYWGTMFGLFFLLNQWGTWALIHQHGGSTTDIAAFITRICRGWIVAAFVGYFLLPVASSS